MVKVNLGMDVVILDFVHDIILNSIQSSFTCVCKC